MEGGVFSASIRRVCSLPTEKDSDILFGSEYEREI